MNQPTSLPRSLFAPALLLLLSASAAACGDAGPAPTAGSVSSTSDAAAVVASARAQLRRVGSHLEASPASRAVTLADRANAAFELRDSESGLSLRASLVGATDAPREDVDGVAVFRGGAGEGTHVLMHARETGAEDYVVLEHPRADAKLSYDVALGNGVAGLRLVANALELIDANGAPRLRVSSPWLVDANGKKREASLSVSGCAVDTDESAPWDRAPTSPGASTCRVSVAWDAADLAYPVVVDPAWGFTTSMHTARYQHSAVALTTTRALVAGGYDNNSVSLASVEIYDATTKTWAVTGAMPSPKFYFALSPISSVFIEAGGVNDVGVLKDAATYNPATGHWTPIAQLHTSRYSFGSTLLTNGGFLVSGGYTGGGVELSSVEIYDPVNYVWNVKAPMHKARALHTTTPITLVGTGRVLVTGGMNDTIAAGLNQDGEVYNPVTNVWTMTPSMSFPRMSHSATLLPNGHVVVAGGMASMVSWACIDYSEVYVPATNTWTGLTTMPESVCEQTDALITTSGGVKQVLITGGEANAANSVPTTNAALYDPASNTWTATTPLPLPISRGTGTYLPGAKSVLIAGGWTNTTPHVTARAEIYTP